MRARGSAAFAGEVLASRHEHTGQGGNSAGVYTKSLTTWKFYTYDHRGRLLHVEQRTEDPLNAGNETESVVLSELKYDLLGQVIQKNLHQDVDHDGFWQEVDFEYNIRGWLTSINELETSTGNTDGFFSMSLNYTGQFNGNIAGITWQIDPGNSTLHQRYSFQYDGMNRLTEADYYEQSVFPGNAQHTGNFDVALSYDANGNMGSLERYGLYGTSSFGKIDDLSYLYTGNQLRRVTDNSSVAQTAGVTQFRDGANVGDDYGYDGNGNLDSDENKGIQSIAYNHINKPTKITYSNGNEIRYFYSADGMKLRQTVYSVGTTDPPVFSITKRSDYLGAIHYEDADGDGITSSLEITFIQHEEGRYRPNGNEMIYEYNLTDHLGNTRITFGDADDDGLADILQENHYYPFGMLMTMTSSPSAAPPNDYLYNGKELQDELGLDWYDYGARMYDASIGRFHVQDRFSEKYLSYSPYQYAANNPILLIDVNGDSIFVSSAGRTYEYRNGDYYDKDRNKVEYNKRGKVTGRGRAFFNRTRSALKETEASGSRGNSLVETLSKSEHKFTIVHANNRPGIHKGENGFRSQNGGANFRGIGSGGTIFFNPNSTSGGLDENGNTERPVFIALAHELAHGEDAERGTMSRDRDPITNVPEAENYATFVENIIRSEAGLPLREFYGYDMSTGKPVGVYRLLVPGTSISSRQRGFDYRPYDNEGIRSFIKSSSEVIQNLQ